MRGVRREKKREDVERLLAVFFSSFFSLSLSKKKQFIPPLEPKHRHIDRLHRSERIEHHEWRPVEAPLRRSGREEHGLRGEAVWDGCGDRRRRRRALGGGAVAPLLRWRCCRSHRCWLREFGWRFSRRRRELVGGSAPALSLSLSPKKEEE